MQVSERLKFRREEAAHAYGPGALLGAWARPAPKPNKPLAGHLVATLLPESLE
jgi:hypothetical protein